MAIHDDALAIREWLDRRPPGPLTRAARDGLRDRIDSLLQQCAASWTSLADDARDGFSDICEALGFKAQDYLYHSAIARTQQASYVTPWRAEYVARPRFRKRIKSALMLLSVASTPPTATAGTKKEKKAGRESEPKPKAGRPTISPEKRKLYARALNLHEHTKRWKLEDKLAEFRRGFSSDVKSEADMDKLIKAAREQAKRDTRK